MEFEVTHITDYTYQYAAAEAYLEARLTPPDTPAQTVRSRRLIVEPAVKVSGYTDYFGNAVEFFQPAVPAPVAGHHQPLRDPDHRAAAADRGAGGEHRRGAADPVLHADGDFRLSPADGDRRQEPRLARTGRGATCAATGRLGEALEALNHAVYEQFAYASGSTTNSTPLSAIWQQRKGVCQDFTHIMLSVLRMAGLPSRYVCGYIEAVAPPSAAAANTLGRAGRTLVGAVATHAWVEVLVPGKQWVALDPTNQQWCGERHITVSRGRDFRDATPLRGTFKGTGKQNMKVKVFVKRRVQPAAAAPASANSLKAPAVASTVTGGPAEAAA